MSVKEKVLTRSELIEQNEMLKFSKISKVNCTFLCLSYTTNVSLN